MGKFFLNVFTPVVYVPNDQRVMGIILRYVCWGTHRPPPWGARCLTSRPTHPPPRPPTVLAPGWGLEFEQAAPLGRHSSFSATRFSPQCVATHLMGAGNDHLLSTIRMSKSRHGRLP